MLTSQQLDDLSQVLMTYGQRLTDDNVDRIKRHLTSLLFNGCKSNILLQFVASNKKTRVGNKFWGLLRSIELDKSLTRTHLRYILKLTIVE